MYIHIYIIYRYIITESLFCIAEMNTVNKLYFNKFFLKTSIISLSHHRLFSTSWPEGADESLDSTNIY